MRDNLRFLRPWIIGAVVWSGIVLAVISALIAQGNTEHFHPVYYLFTVLWLQFGFAGTFQLLRNWRLRVLPYFLLVILLPPFILYFIIFRVF